MANSWAASPSSPPTSRIGKRTPERYRGWVDGGMFAMSLVYGLHAEGPGAVMLNWSAPRAQDRALRKLTGIPDSALIITTIGFGNLPPELRVSVSQRKPLSYAMSPHTAPKG